MTKLSSVGVAIAFATMALLAGCQLYFGSNGGNGNGGPGGGNPPGAQCNGDTQCAAGCFCQKGVCTEGGFCGVDKDCGAGFHCDANRSSCVPNPSCTMDAQCKQGSMCDSTKGSCVATCSCTTDADAVRLGFAWCDEGRNTCMTGADPAGMCLGVVTCTTAVPSCPEGQVALRKDGCFTGQCRAIAACEGAPSCDALQHETDCLGRATDCSAVYNGRGCHKPDGSACHAGDTDCVCDSYTFAKCDVRTSTTPRVIIVD